MQRIRLHSLAFGVTIVFIVFIVILILQPFNTDGENITELHKGNEALIFLLITTSTTMWAVIQYWTYVNSLVIKKLQIDNKTKNDQIIENQKDYLTRIEELIESINGMDKFYIEKWSLITSDIRDISKRLDEHSEKIRDLQNRNNN
ncbi:MAG: hypothetical protein ACXAAH_12470 [Promethearchaeota archaeon]